MNENSLIRLSNYVANLLTIRPVENVLGDLRPLLLQFPNREDDYLKDFICCTHLIMASHYVDGVIKEDYWKPAVSSFSKLLSRVPSDCSNFWDEAFGLLDKYDAEFGVLE